MSTISFKWYNLYDLTDIPRNSQEHLRFHYRRKSNKWELRMHNMPNGNTSYLKKALYMLA